MNFKNLLADNLKVRLFMVSFLMLFLELALIRWIPSYIRLVGYFSNLILLASFLGIGLGLLTNKFKRNLLNLFPCLLFLLIVLVLFAHVDVKITSPQVLFFKSGKTYEVDPQYLLPLIFSAVAAVFVPLGQELGRLFGKFQPLSAYSLDILGALAGIVIFSVLSFFSAPAYLWFLVVSLLILLLIKTGKGFASYLTIFVTALIVIFPLAVQLTTGDFWSPYYRINLSKIAGKMDEYQLDVNNIPHQSLSRPSSLEPFYFVPYRSFKNTSYEKVLVVGSGAGNDVAILLKNAPSVKEVDAVEIDPKIAEIGKKLHPERPYQDSRVKLHINDGRSFLQNTDKKYDLIIFALPDSLTLIANSANLRLESFLFTKEAFEQSRQHLESSGLFVLYNYYRTDWLIDKIALMLKDVFGKDPYVSTYGEVGKAATILAGPKTVELTSQNEIKVRRVGYNLAGSSDNWPFLYLKEKTMPALYLKFLAVILEISFLAIFAVLKAQKKGGFNWRFFFFGAAFLLLETKSLVTFGLLFGNTWLVNSLVFSGILLFVLLANLISTRFSLKPIWLLYLFLILSLVLIYLTPPASFLALSLLWRYSAATSFYFLPILLANLLFSQKFKETKQSATSFGSNLLGAVFGGVVEYFSLVTGYQFLILIVILFYLLSLVKIENFKLAIK